MTILANVILAQTLTSSLGTLGGVLVPLPLLMVCILPSNIRCTRLTSCEVLSETPTGSNGNYVDQPLVKACIAR